MAKMQGEKVAVCPNPICNTSLYSNHDSPWCFGCGETLPANVQELLPRLQGSRRASHIEGETGDQTVPKVVDADALNRRYRDSYAISRVIIGAGSGVKSAGILLGIFLALASFSTDGNWIFIGLCAALLVGVSFYISGVFVTAQGQILRAALDTAVNSSPLLENQQKAEILAQG